MKEPKCTRCNDTGVEETGNNDLPCHCPAGDLAVFNAASRAGHAAEEEAFDAYVAEARGVEGDPLD